MFIHLGGGKSISISTIVAILCFKKRFDNNESGYYLNINLENQNIEKIEGEEYKSVVVTTDRVYLSPISAITLKKRATFISSL